jgi:signal transduction histidine kinase/ligand-binding sensor domain-containing protein
VFTRYTAENGLANPFVRALLEDEQGNLWIGTDHGYFLRDVSGSIQRLDGTREVPVAAIFNIRQDGRGRVWAASNQGLLVASGPVVQVYRRGGVPVSNGPALLTMDGSVWWFGGAALWRVSEHSEPVSIPVGNVLPIVLHKDASGQVWVGTVGSGLVRVRDNRLFTEIQPALPDQTILSILSDRDQSLWVGTPDGLTRITRSLVETFSKEKGLPTNNVSTVYEDTDGSIWIGGVAPAMSRIAPGSRKAAIVPAPAAGFRPRIVVRARNGDLWFGSTVDGIVRVHQGKTTVFTRRQGLRSNSVRQILEDRRGRIWVALGSGLAVFDGQNLRTFYLEDGLVYGSVRCLLELPDGDLLVGTDGGVSRIRDLRFVDDKTLAPLNGEKIWAMVPDPDSGVWIGTRGAGLFRLRDGTLRSITVRDGLPGNNIYQLLTDGRRNLWMTGAFGIASVSWQEIDAFADRKIDGLSVVTWGLADGLKSTEMNGGLSSAAILSRSGDLWFATVKGAVRIKPNLPRPRRRLQVLIESLRAGDEELLPAASIVVRPGRQRVQISYTACDLLTPSEARFRYKLEGFDSAWTFDSQRRTAVYTNLPPGSYKFHVASVGAHSSESAVSFTVQPHFTQTGLFRASLAATALLAISGIFVLYARQTRARWTVRLDERTRLAREMHDTLIQGCVGISALLEAAASASGASGQNLVEEARKQIRMTLDEARQAVWDLRHKDVEGDLVSSLREFTARFARESTVKIGFEVTGPRVRLDIRAERNLLLIAREAIRNALLHAQPARIDLRLRFEPRDVYLEVRDDGRGFPTDRTEPGHYGIIGMRERVEELGGSLQIESEPGRGCCLLARMPMQVQE